RARSSTMAERWPRNRLNRVLLPTFGRPTIATTGIPPRPLATSGGTRGADLVGTARSRRERGRPAGRCRGAIERGVGQRGGVGLHLGRAGHLQDVLGHVAQVLDRGGSSAC